jgi:hypothetical protein
MEYEQIPVRKDVFERLKRLAEPLVDNPSSVIERLAVHWEKTHCAPDVGIRISSSIPPLTEWRSARGERFAVGLVLRAFYLSHQFEAMVTAAGIEFNGKMYDNPSSAGIAAKLTVGKKGPAANTNGWDFWQMLDPATKRWVSIDALRRRL